MAAACTVEPLPVRERASHPWALTLTAPDAAALAVDLPRVRAAHPNRPLRWMTASEDVDIQLAALGFRTVRVTTGGEIVLAEVDRAPFRTARDALTASDLTVTAVRPEDLPRWVEATARRYRGVHRINPLADMSGAELRGQFVGDDYIPGAGFAVARDEAVLAHGSLRLTDAGYDIGWFGAEPAADLSAHTLNLAVMDAVLRAADVAGTTRVYAEFDSTDPQALAMLEMFTLEDAEVWRTYQTAVPDGADP